MVLPVLSAALSDLSAVSDRLDMECAMVSWKTSLPRRTYLLHPCANSAPLNSGAESLLHPLFGHLQQLWWSHSSCVPDQPTDCFLQSSSVTVLLLAYVSHGCNGKDGQVLLHV
jgi:hypothetical protein